MQLIHGDGVSEIHNIVYEVYAHDDDCGTAWEDLWLEMGARCVVFSIEGRVPSDYFIVAEGRGTNIEFLEEMSDFGASVVGAGSILALKSLDSCNISVFVRLDKPANEHKADFLWPHDPNSPKEAAYADGPPCRECGAMTPEQAETMCLCAGDKDNCHGCSLWPG